MGYRERWAAPLAELDAAAAVALGDDRYIAEDLTHIVGGALDTLPAITDERGLYRPPDRGGAPATRHAPVRRPLHTAGRRTTPGNPPPRVPDDAMTSTAAGDSRR